MILSQKQWAHRYVRLGWHVFPVNVDKTPRTERGFKDATNELEKINKWWATPSDQVGIAVATGEISGIVVIDVDVDKPGTEGNLQKLFEAFPGVDFHATAVARSGGGGWHFFFSHPGEKFVVKNRTNLLGIPGVDVRGDGGYIILAPTLHQSGKTYTWVDEARLFSGPFLACPESLYDQSPSSNGTKSFELPQTIPEGQRNSTLAAHAGLLRSLGMSIERMLPIVQALNLDQCVPPLPEDEVIQIVRSTGQYPPYRNRGETSVILPPTTSRLLQLDRTDKGYGEMISLVHRGKLAFDHSQGKWLLWRGHWWEVDRQGEIVQMTFQVADLFKEAASTLQDDDSRSRAFRYAYQMQNLSQVTSALNVAKTLPGVATGHEDWNVDHDVFAVQNGVIELRTGAFREGRPGEYISAHSPVVYDPKATCPRWDQFLTEVFQGDQEIISYVQKAVGYSLTGQTLEQCLFLLVGNGANGKSVFLETLQTLMGDYATVTPFSTLLRTSGAAAQTNDIAALEGKRFVVSSETTQSSLLDEGRVKSLTGGDHVSARFLHQEFFTFKPVLKLWLGVNHLPRVNDESDGFWRRVRRINFPAKFTGSKADPNLAARLRAEAPGILNWALKGARDWYASGLKTPVSVDIATTSYRIDSDPMADFLSQHCQRGEGLSVTVDELYRVYIEDSRQRGLKSYDIVSLARFRTRLDKDFSRSGHVYTGVSLTEGAQRRFGPDMTTIQITRVHRPTPSVSLLEDPLVED